jgi:hypothetical protein
VAGESTDRLHAGAGGLLALVGTRVVAGLLCQELPELVSTGPSRTLFFG